MTTSPIRGHARLDVQKPNLQILSKSVNGFPSCKGPNMGVFHWLWQSPLQQVSTIVLPVMMYFLLIWLKWLNFLCLTLPYVIISKLNKKLIRRWDSERKISLRRHRTRTTNYNRLVHKFRHRSMRGYVLERMFTKFSKITHCNGHLHCSRSFKVTDFGTNRGLIYNFLLVINTN